MAASRQDLELLHRLLTKNMVSRLEEDAEQNMLTDAATLGAISKFLKDNNVTADPAEQGDLQNLREKLAQQAQARKKLASNVIQLAEQDAKEA